MRKKTIRLPDETVRKINEYKTEQGIQTDQEVFMRLIDIAFSAIEAERENEKERTTEEMTTESDRILAVGPLGIPRPLVNLTSKKGGKEHGGKESESKD